MTPAERVVDALLSGDVDALRLLTHADSVRDVAVAGLARLAPADALTNEELALLRAVSGHPGLSAAELTRLVGTSFGPAASRLLDLGLVVSSRFDRHDCWVRTTRGAAALRPRRGADQLS